MSEETASLSKSTAKISVYTTISRITGFIAIIVLAYALGNTNLADSYNLANTIPNMLYELVLGGILTSLFIPIFMDHLIKDKEKAWKVVSNIANISILFLIVMAIIGTVFSFYFIRVQTFLLPADAKKVELASFFFKFFVWEIVFYGACSILNGILQSLKRFSVPAAAPILNNLVTIATVLFIYMPLRDASPEAALVGLAIGTTFGVMAMALVQIPALLKVGYKHHWILDFKDETFLKLAALALPVFGYVASNQLGQIVVNILAFQFTSGFSYWTYAWRFYQLPYGILAVSIATVLFPYIAERSSKDDIDGIKEYLSLGVRTTSFVILPATAFIFILSKPLILTTISHGAFTESGGLKTAEVLGYFSLGLLPFSLHMFVARIFYALKDTMTPMKMNALGVPLMIVMDIILVRYFEVAGLAMGNSITYAFTTTLLFLALRKRIGPLGARNMVRKALRFTIISIISGFLIVVATGHPFFSGTDFTSSLLSLIVGLTVGIGSYLIINHIMKTEETEFIWDMFRGILRRWRNNAKGGQS